MMLQKLSKNKLKLFRQLQQKKYRKEHGLYLISGLRAAQEALTSSQLKLKSILVSEAHLSLMNELPPFDCKEVFTLTEKEFSQVVDEKHPQGIALIAQRPQFQLNIGKLPPRLLFLEHVNDPGNLGTLLRSAAWFGWSGVLLSPDSVDPFAPKTVRASAGCVAHLAIYEQVSPDLLHEIKSQNDYQLIASTVEGGKKLSQFFPGKKQRMILALGAEAHGLSNQVLKMSDLQLTIPRNGWGESLNLAMAGTIFLYHFTLINKQTLPGKDVK